MKQKSSYAQKQESTTKLVIGISAITAAVIAGYFGLDYFAGKKAVAEPAATVQTASGDYSAAVAASTENDAATAASGSNLTEADAKRIGEEVARQVAAQVAQSIVDQQLGAGASGGSGGLSEADARRIGEEEGRRVAQEVATASIQQALAAGGKSRGEVETTRAAADHSPAEHLATSYDSPAPAAPTSPKPAKSKPTPQKAGNGSDALTAWWTAPPSGDFGLVYAGQAKGEPAIALLFSEQPADSALNQNVKVYDAKGALVSGSWEAAANPRLAVLRGLKPGRYTVVVESALTDASGKAVSAAQHGPVYVI
ncbi:MAG: hypothetical protein NTX56_05555 [Proteobacteria bacterium]|nr:hypothetical protein [Pseudomonadota bacterium]